MNLALGLAGRAWAGGGNGVESQDRIPEAPQILSMSEGVRVYLVRSQWHWPGLDSRL